MFLVYSGLDRSCRLAPNKSLCKHFHFEFHSCQHFMSLSFILCSVNDRDNNWLSCVCNLYTELVIVSSRFAPTGIPDLNEQ